MKILTVCGSLRARSSNRAILEACERLGGPRFAFTHFDDLAALPAFNPDLDGDTPPSAVVAWRRQVGAAEALIFSTPEYAHGLPGALKNALDWLVSDPAFAGKPAAILHAYRGSDWALDSLREILRTMSAQLVDGASANLPLTTNRIDADAILARPELRDRLARSLDALAAELAQSAPRAGS